jgi:concanavalin A-like lectin/glucanase superfamily protein
MPRVAPHVQNLLSGQNDRANPTGLPLGQHTSVRNTRFNEGIPTRRPGFVRLDKVTETGDCLRLNASELGVTDADAYVRIPVHSIHQLPTAWTIDIAVNPDEATVTGDGLAQILGFVGGENTFTLFWTGDRTFLFWMVDTSGQLYTLESSVSYPVSAPDTTIPIRLTRNGSVLTMRIADVTVASRSDLNPTLKSVAPTTDLLVGSTSDGTDDEWSFSGVVDDLRIFHVYLEGQKHAWCEWPDPRYPGMVAYYRFGYDADGLVKDESPYGNHGLATGNYTFLTPGLVYGLEPAVGIHQHQHSSGARKVLVAAGEQLFVSQVV